MAFPKHGVQEFQRLLLWNIKARHQGVAVDFCRFVSERLEEKFRSSFGRPSKISNNDRYWISESTVSRWLRSASLDIKVQLLNYLSSTELLLNPETLRPLTTVELLNILQGGLNFKYPVEQEYENKN